MRYNVSIKLVVDAIDEESAKELMSRWFEFLEHVMPEKFPTRDEIEIDIVP